jgi:hypothetical protein
LAAFVPAAPVIGRSLAKIVAGIGLAGFSVIELGSPLWTKAALDGTAHDAANDAAFALVRTNDRDQAYAAAREDADHGGAKLDEFFLDNAGIVHVTLSKQAKSYLLHNFEKTRGWYEVRLRATSQPTGR